MPSATATRSNGPKATEELLRSAQKVLATEQQGLQALQDWLGDPFVQAVEQLFATKGRIIVSGMGKSGHIARKIAATFASTGSPALFVHPAEASHGDLGMITPQDVVLLLSNSGETSELGDILAHAARFSVPLIGVARRSGSMLSEAADVALILPETPEACHVGAPTTSTTMMLALGDALAVALLERRGFDHEDFGTLHPGGKLGAKLMRVDQLMHRGDALPLVQEGTLMSEVLLTMTAGKVGCAGVTDKAGTLVGVITDGDLRRHMAEDLLRQEASHIMTSKPITVAPHILAVQALKIMEDNAIGALFVVENNQPVGVLHLQDVLRAGVV